MPRRMGRLDIVLSCQGFIRHLTSYLHCQKAVIVSLGREEESSSGINGMSKEKGGGKKKREG